ncbi:hypothetical protein FOBRF1_005241 [Fusarium oxysporum]
MHYILFRSAAEAETCKANSAWCLSLQRNLQSRPSTTTDPIGFDQARSRNLNVSRRYGPSYIYPITVKSRVHLFLM